MGDGLLRAAILILGALLASCSAERSAPPGQAENGSWSTIVDGLQARLSIERGEVEDEVPIIAVWIEMRNVSGEAHPLIIDWDDGRSLRFALKDQVDRDFEQGALAYDGWEAPAAALAIPARSSVRLYVSRSGAGIGRNLKALIDLGPTATYEIANGDPHTYFLQCTLSVAAPAADDRPREDFWHGRLTIPSIMVGP